MSLIATLGRCAGYTFGALLDELYPVQAVPRAQDQADLLQEAEAEEEVWEPEDIPAGVSAPSPPVAAPPAGLTWAQYIEPAICDVLAEHKPYQYNTNGYLWCLSSDGFDNHATRGDWDWQEWREHVAPLIADRIETATLALDPAAAARAADQRITDALNTFEQHKK